MDASICAEPGRSKASLLWAPGVLRDLTWPLSNTNRLKIYVVLNSFSTSFVAPARRHFIVSKESILCSLLLQRLKRDFSHRKKQVKQDSQASVFTGKDNARHIQHGVLKMHRHNLKEKHPH